MRMLARAKGGVRAKTHPKGGVKVGVPECEPRGRVALIWPTSARPGRRDLQDFRSPQEAGHSVRGIDLRLDWLRREIGLRALRAQCLCWSGRPSAARLSQRRKGCGVQCLMPMGTGKFRPQAWHSEFLQGDLGVVLDPAIRTHGEKPWIASLEKEVRGQRSELEPLRSQVKHGVEARNTACGQDTGEEKEKKADRKEELKANVLKNSRVKTEERGGKSCAQKVRPRGR